MSTLPRVILHQHKVNAVKRFHPWIFSGAVKTIEGSVSEGAIVVVYSETGEYLATGHYGLGSIAVKIFCFQPVTDFRQLLWDKLQTAYAVRQQLGLTDHPLTNCYRLVNAEGDGLPGLVIDWYKGTAVLQAHSIGMYAQRAVIAAGLQRVYGDRLTAIYDKSAAVLFHPSVVDNDYLLGEPCTQEVCEYGHRFLVDWEAGQKTGFFLDQREHRALLAKYVAGQQVLNTFCYSGGFSVYAVTANAKFVHSVDSSSKAIAWTQDNVNLNNTAQVPHATFTEDVFNFLKHCDAEYDVIVLDPPAFAKKLSARHQAAMAYKRLNQMAIAKVRPGGMIMTFSCSQVVGPEQFQGAVMAAAIESGKPVRILHHLTQPPDHPVSLYHPEGLYLKGLVLRVE